MSTLPWNAWNPFNKSEDKKSRPGGSFGCDLSIDVNDGSVFVARIALLGPAAISGQLAVGDVITKIDGKQLDRGSSDGESLHSLTEGEAGAPIWLEVRDKEGKFAATTRLVRQGPLDDKEWNWSKLKEISPFSSKTDFTKLPALGYANVLELGVVLKLNDAGNVSVSEIIEGGAAWLASQQQAGGMPPIGIGDAIIEIDEKPLPKKTVACAAEMLKGREFSRVKLKILREGGEQEVMGEAAGTISCCLMSVQIFLVRITPIKQNHLENVIKFQNTISNLPPIPPSERVR